MSELELSDGQWDKLDEFRNRASAVPEYDFGVEVLDAILALRPVPVRPVGEATIEPDWGKISADILTAAEGEEWAATVPVRRRSFPKAVRAVVGPLLAAPAGTPSGRWLCTTHNDTLDGPPGPFHDGPECRIVELLVPATTEPEPDEPKPSGGVADVEAAYGVTFETAADQAKEAAARFAPPVPPSGPSVEDIAKQIHEHQAIQFGAQAKHWSDHEEIYRDLLTAAVEAVLGPVLDRLTAAEAHRADMIEALKVAEAVKMADDDYIVSVELRETRRGE